MPSNLQKNWKLLQTIARNKHARSRKTQLKRAVEDNDFCRCVREICHNIVKRKVSLPLKDVKKLQKHKKSILSLAKKGQSKKLVQHHIVQSGNGFLPILIPLLSVVLERILKK